VGQIQEQAIRLWLRATQSDERASSLVEYALMLALIALACLAALSTFGITNGGSINSSASRITNAGL